MWGFFIWIYRDDDFMTLPRYLYHYTSQKGLLGILDTGKLWMTDILYLNDSSEFSHTIDLVKTEMTKQKKLLPSRKGLMTSELSQEDVINNNIHDTFDRIEGFLNNNLKKFNGLTVMCFRFHKMKTT